MWGVIWFPTWFWIEVVRKIKKRPRMDNCLSWALRKWEAEGGYLVIRWCRSNRVQWIRWPHFLWLDINDHQNLRHFIPKEDDQSTRWIPEAWFDGKIQKGDPEDQLEN